MKRERDPKTRGWLAELGRRLHPLRRSRLPVLALGLSLLASPRWVSAAPISQARVVKAVETWVRQVTADARADAVVERLEPYRENGVTMAYVVHLAQGGFCLAGADSLVLPVYFYCPQGLYDPKNPDCRAILKGIAQRQSALQTEVARKGVFLQTCQAELSRRAGAWEDLAAGKGTTSKAAQPLAHRVPQGGPVAQGTPAGPVSMVLSNSVTSKWNQNPPPYNDYCPTLPAGVTPAASNLTVVGCVATATAQLMYSWRWPSSGVGSGTDTYNYGGTDTPLTTTLANDPGIIPSDFTQHLSWASGKLTMTGWWDGSMYTQAQQFTNGSSANPAYEKALTNLYNKLTTHQTALTANFATPLNWSAMQDTYAYGGASPANTAESQVAYLGYELGVAVKMDYGVSGSSSFPTAIPGVLTNNFHYDPSAQDTVMDANQMVLEIQWLRPFIVGGNDHCWLIYGYNMGTSPWQFMMNMGWGGTENGWYTLDNVDVRELTLPTDLTYFVWGLAPLNVVGFVGASSSGNGSPNSPYQNVAQALSKAPDGATLILQAGSVNTFSAAPLVINRPLTLKGYQATITKQ
jgi:hypothetical protein